MDRRVGVLVLVVAAGCGGFSGGKGQSSGGFASTGAPISTATGGAITRDPRGYTFDAVYQPGGSAGDAVTAIGAVGSGSFYVGTSFLGRVDLVDAAGTTQDGQLLQNVHGFAVVGSTVLAQTSNPGAPRSASVYVRGVSSWLMSFDNTGAEGAVCVQGGQVFAFSGADGASASVAVLSSSGGAWSALGVVPTVPAAAASHKGQLWVGGRATDQSGLARLHRSTDGVA